jgi:hypothetical protein
MDLSIKNNRELIVVSLTDILQRRSLQSSADIDRPLNTDRDGFSTHRSTDSVEISFCIDYPADMRKSIPDQEMWPSDLFAPRDGACARSHVMSLSSRKLQVKREVAFRSAVVGGSWSVVSGHLIHSSTLERAELVQDRLEVENHLGLLFQVAVIGLDVDVAHVRLAAVD